MTGGDGRVLIGTSGWHYRHWRGGFYPAELTTAEWLGYYAQRFSTVEINNAFYRLPDRSTFARWAATLPQGFTVALKASRYLTHVRRLKEPEEPVARLMERAGALGPKLGPVLLQLPPTLSMDAAALDRTLDAFPSGVRVAVEVRHPSWATEETRRVLENHGAAFCLTDTSGVHGPLWRTAPWGYVRMHGGRARPESCYGRTALRTWAERLASMWPPTADVYVYFNNDTNGCALRDARRFALAIGRVGMTPTGVPPARETPVS